MESIGNLRNLTMPFGHPPTGTTDSSLMDKAMRLRECP